ncbi:hypothetical protein, partial [Candidatus Hodgkinia cicadicola]|uniref:hypothetical protein n=1 Tax=Candidatus Hodgkinia cicadicola TaxID=573658 RepID=UPI001788C67F
FMWWFVWSNWCWWGLEFGCWRLGMRIKSGLVSLCWREMGIAGVRYRWWIGMDIDVGVGIIGD